MSHIINVPVSKLGKSFEIDWDALPQVSKDFIIAYGLKQKLNDGHSQFTEKSGDKEYLAKSEAIVESTIEGLMSGNVRLNRAAGMTNEEQLVVEFLVLKGKTKKVAVAKLEEFKAKYESAGADKMLAALGAKLGIDRAEITRLVNEERARKAARKGELLSLEVDDLGIE